jgi:hypothetical protein
MVLHFLGRGVDCGAHGLGRSCSTARSTAQYITAYVKKNTDVNMSSPADIKVILDATTTLQQDICRCSTIEVPYVANPGLNGLSAAKSC